ncbi:MULTISPECIES: hypothetical protein [Pseudomonas]|uniref:hypothetical protein n=1 Tax=Pseudomonas nitroreducens TaxID=46680 RepID=UPI001E5B9898|nr:MULTISPECIES: hypothetical protein [Pseudomonas]MCE4069661.1 hypothetical protein [Pseudomonas nitritireducens]MCE4079176.1 hypothetical protein [Pseudomonas nitroreducens]
MRTPEEIEARVKVFAPLGPILDSEFSALLSRLLFLLREYGISKVKPDVNNQENHLEFAKYVHEGWKIAHSEIAEKIVFYLGEIDKLEEQKKSNHKKKNAKEKQDCIKQIEILHARIKILRRFYDSIVWMFLFGEHSSIRRFVSAKGKDNLSPGTIAEAEEYLQHANADSNTIAICSDITTFIHSGDVLQFNIKSGLSLIELKRGEKNKQLAEAAEFSVASGCPHFVELFSQDLNSKEKKQFERVIKQLDIAKKIVTVIKEGKGKDINSDATISTPEVNIPPRFYTDTIVNLYQQLNKEKSWAIATIDNCLHIGVYSDRKMAMVGFNAWMDGEKCTDKVYNILHFIKDPLVRPLPYFDLPTELLNKIIHDEIIVAICLDIPHFIEESNKLHPGLLSLMSKKDSREILSGWHQPLHHHGQIVQYQHNDIEGWLGSGLLSRIIYDFQKPLSVIEFHYQSIVDEAYSELNDR